MGQAFGELALVAARKPRSRTVAASTAGGGSSSGPAQQQGGVHLATLHRSSLSHMRFVAAASVRKGSRGAAGAQGPLGGVRRDEASTALVACHWPTNEGVDMSVSSTRKRGPCVWCSCCWARTLGFLTVSCLFWFRPQADAGRALQSVLAACCMGVLRVPPGSRTQEEVDTLAEFFGVMEVSRRGRGAGAA